MRQQAEAEAKDDIVSTISIDGKAIADIKLRDGGCNQKIEIILKQGQTKR